MTEARQELQHGLDADGWIEVANDAVLRADFERADTAARLALAEDTANRRAWLAMAAGYAGLGWFEQSRTCLRRINDQPLTTEERRLVGRAVNRWALGATRWPWMTLVLAPVIGALAIAVGTSLPMAARNRRLAVLRRFEMEIDPIEGVDGWSWPPGATAPEPNFWALADQAWPLDWRLRLGHVAAVVASIVLWVAAWGSDLGVL